MPKRPRDPSQLAKLTVDMATGHVRNDSFDQPPPDSPAVKMGRKGGKTRADKMSPAERSAAAAKAANSRWKK